MGYLTIAIPVFKTLYFIFGENEAGETAFVGMACVFDGFLCF